jgi:hypothetical protein
MSILSELMKRPKPVDTIALSIFLGSILYTVIAGSPHTLIAGLAFVLMMLGALPKQVALAFLVGASVIILLQTKRGYEGFENQGSSGAAPTGVEPAPEKTEDKGESEAFKNKVILPDNADRKEPLELGKPYKLPSESDDKGYHLDSGTTFLNAYKSLKPDQIAAMTKDTQELMATQKNLMSTLEALKPMLNDGQNMMNMFGSFFGGQK